MNLWENFQVEMKSKLDIKYQIAINFANDNNEA